MKIILTGGGSGGHVFPNLSLVNLLKEKFDEVIYIGEKGGIEENACKNYKIKFYGVKAVKFIRGFSLLNFLIPFKLIEYANEVKKLLDKIKPDVVFSKGGYVTLPVSFAAKRLKIPVIVHESDLSLGLANRIVSKFSCKTLTSFPISSEKINCKYIYVGTPIRDEILKAKKEKLFSNNRPVLLIIGGSGGAKELNEIIIRNINQLLANFNVVHVMGKKNYVDYGNFDNLIKIPFTNEMGKYISSSDLVISRGGANALFEIIAMKKPSLIFPLKNSKTRGDQVENSEYFKKLELIDVYDESKPFLEQVNMAFSKRFFTLKKIEESGISDGKEKIVNEILKSVFSF